MANFLVSGAPKFPEGTVLTAYLQRDWAGPPPQPGDKPRAAVGVVSEPVDDRGYAEVSGLAADSAYYVGAEVSGVWAWLAMRTPPDSGGGGGGGGGGGTGTVKSVNGISPDIDGAVVIPRLVQAVEKPLGLRSGTIALDMEGNNFVVFTVTLTAATAHFTEPINLPASGGVFFEVKITGKYAWDATFLERWEYGREPTWDLASASSINRLAGVTDDLGLTWQGIGSEKLPDGTLVVVGTPSTSDSAKWDGTKWVPYGPTALIDARLALKSILTGEHAMAYTNAPSAAGQVPLTTSTTQSVYTDLQEYILTRSMAALKPQAVLTGNTQLVEDRFYPCSKNNAVLKLPVGAGNQLPGRPVAVQNVSGGTLKIEGKQNTAVPSEVTTTEIKGAETVWFIATGGSPEENVWIPLIVGRTLADVEALIKALAPVIGATTPAEGAEGSITAGETGVSHRTVFNIVGDGSKTAWKLVHNLNTKAITVSMQTEESKKPRKQILSLATELGSTGEVKSTSNNEVEVVFETAPIAKKSYFVSVSG